MKDEGLTGGKDLRSIARDYCNGLVDCVETFDAIIAMCSVWLETDKYSAQKMAMIIALAETGKTSATASMED